MLVNTATVGMPVLAEPRFGIGSREELRRLFRRGGVHPLEPPRRVVDRSRFRNLIENGARLRHLIDCPLV